MLSDVAEKLVEKVGQSKRFEVMLGKSAPVFVCLFCFFFFQSLCISDWTLYIILLTTVEDSGPKFANSVRPD